MWRWQKDVTGWGREEKSQKICEVSRVQSVYALLASIQSLGKLRVSIMGVGSRVRASHEYSLAGLRP